MKTILISGCSKGLGLALAEYFLQNGNRVYGFSRSKSEQVEQLEKKYSQMFKFAENDISKANQIDAVMEGASAFLNKIDCLINNAAIAHDSLLVTMKDSKIEQMLDINLKGTILLTKAITREMILSNSGNILNISSIVSHRGYSGLSVYSATKAALDGLTRSLARELGKRNIRINSICPGFMETDMSKGLNDKQTRQILKRTPLGRLVELQEVAKLAEFLMSDGAKSITGQSILIDGGISC